MLRERVSNDIYVFTSDLYAQVTAGAIITPKGAILVDTLPFPAESREMATFIRWACRPGVRYVILTHYHADHVYGAYLFPQADVISHAKCRQLLIDVGVPTLKRAKAQEPELEEVKIRLPDITFEEEEMGIQLAERDLRLIYAPGHTTDSVMVYVADDRVLFAADTMMPVPAIADGDVDSFRQTLSKIVELPINALVQGHGEIVLRGEVEPVVERSLGYLDTVEELVAEAIEKAEDGREWLQQNSIESCGLSRIPLNGLVQQIHVSNLLALYDRRIAE